MQRNLDDYSGRWVAMYTESCEATSVRGEQSARLMDLQMTCLHTRRTEVALLVEGLRQADAEMLRSAVQATLALGDLDRCADNEALLAEVPPPDDPAKAAAVAAVREKIARVKVTGSLGQFKTSRALMEEAVGEAMALGYTPLEAEALVRQADLMDLAGDPPTAERLFMDAYFKAGVAGHERVQAEAAISLTYVLGSELARYDEALVWDRHAVMLMTRLGNPVALQINRLNGLATLMRAPRQLRRGPAIHRAARSRWPRPTRESDPLRLATVLLNSGSLFLAQSNYVAAEQRYQRSLEIFAEALGPNNPAVPDCLNNLGQVAFLQADVPRAKNVLHCAPSSPGRTAWARPTRDSPTRSRTSPASPSTGRDYAARARVPDPRPHAAGHRQGPRRPRRRRPARRPRRARRGARRLGRGRGEGHALGGDVRASPGPRPPLPRPAPVRPRRRGPRSPRLPQVPRAVRARPEDRRESLRHRRPRRPRPALEGLGRIALAEKRPRDAIAPLERANELLQTIPRVPDKAASIRFLLAQALWDAKGDRTRAVELATVARAGYEKAGPRFTPERDAVDAWLASHE